MRIHRIVDFSLRIFDTVESCAWTSTRHSLISACNKLHVNVGPDTEWAVTNSTTYITQFCGQHKRMANTATVL